MQKDNPDTPKIQHIKRVRNTAVSDSVRGHRSDTRATIAPSDFSGLKEFPKRKILMERSSMLPSQILMNTTQIIDPESSDTELMFLYDEYLRNIMTEIVLKKEVEDTQKLIISQLATIDKEIEENEEKLFKLQTRERDIVNLSKLQNHLDSQIADVNDSAKGEDIKTLKDLLFKLHSLLRPLDMLRCNNIILPETPEEWEETNKVLKSCSDTLKSIMDLIGTKTESYQSVNNGLKDFLSTHSDIEDKRKRLEQEICNLQALVLKTASLTLMQSHN